MKQREKQLFAALKKRNSLILLELLRNNNKFLWVFRYDILLCSNFYTVLEDILFLQHYKLGSSSTRSYLYGTFTLNLIQHLSYNLKWDFSVFLSLRYSHLSRSGRDPFFIPSRQQQCSMLKIFIYLPFHIYAPLLRKFPK